MLARRVWNPCLAIFETSKRTFSSRTHQICPANILQQKPFYSASLQNTCFPSLRLPSYRFYAATVPNEKLSTDSNEKSQENEKKPESPPDTNPNKESQAATPNKEKQLMEEIAKLESSSKNAHDKYLRALAETENVRQRLTRQIDDAKQFGIQSFVKDLLEVSDILSKAMGSVPEDALSDKKNPHLQNLFEGLRLTEAQLNKVFKKHGLEKIEAMGAKFDPNVHEALFEAPGQQGQEPGTVMAVTQTGFKLNNRTIRPARVGVAK
ncbi:grpE protein homolog 1, mitochondrial-like isoform X2 [Paramacrobiotus metropolitanus]|uniref:grpE protein homolog 1, mitochondrial-like isoform X2 n=1 Tax=Paramacrobiotus metropolitanus TaxID=2943436 RepID=UPI0024458F98|nr:grpE protein homolog 1, mitochondrial-like isoform X2 [Paramacrobiotus metropolitanus]